MCSGSVRLSIAEHPLQLVGALLGEHRGLQLLVHVVVPLVDEARNQLRELVVGLDGLLDLARDDQRRPRFVDQDEVDLVDDRVPQFALDQVLAADHHVVAQVVEPELVVGAVRDVGEVRLAPGRGTEVHDAGRRRGDPESTYVGS